MHNCETCDFKKMIDAPGAHCYMFMAPPSELCMKHTGLDWTSPFTAFSGAFVNVFGSLSPDLQQAEQGPSTSNPTKG